MKKKSKCPYCYGHGMNKFWWDNGILTGKGERMHVRWINKDPKPDSYQCDRCKMPKSLPPCEKKWG